MNLFELFVKIGVKDEASDKLSKLSGKIGDGLKTAAKVGTAAVTALGTASVALGAGFIKAAGDVSRYGDNIDKMSQKMGLSAEAYQEWDFIMQHSGTSMEALKAGMKTLANAVDSGNDAFERLGITQSDIASMNQEELFAKTIEQLQKVDNETKRTYLAGQLLGRGATELGALLNTSAEDTEAMRQQVHELGGVMSNEAVKAAAAYQDSLQNMQVSLSGLKNNLMSQFLPSITTVMDGLSLIFSGQDGGIEMITDGVEDLTTELIESIPKIFEVGGAILEGLATAILDNLPLLIDTAVDIVLELAKGLISALPTLVESALSLITTLANGITKAIQDDGFIQTIIDVVLQIVETLTDPETLTNLLNAGLDLLLALVEGLLSEESITALVDAVFLIIENLMAFFYDPENIAKVWDIGIKLIVALVKGLFMARVKMLEGAKELISNLWDKFTNTDWLQLGKDIMNSVWDGLVDIWNSLVDWFSNEFDWFSGWFNDSTDTGGWSGGGGANKRFIDGSHAGGLSYVPFDGYIAELHKGERVLTASEARRYNNGGGYNGGTSNVNVTVGIDDTANAMGLARALLPFLKIAEKEVYA